MGGINHSILKNTHLTHVKCIDKENNKRYFYFEISAYDWFVTHNGVIPVKDLISMIPEENRTYNSWADVNGNPNTQVTYYIDKLMMEESLEPLNEINFENIYSYLNLYVEYKYSTFDIRPLPGFGSDGSIRDNLLLDQL